MADLRKSPQSAIRLKKAKKPWLACYSMFWLATRRGRCEISPCAKPHRGGIWNFVDAGSTGGRGYRGDSQKRKLAPLTQYPIIHVRNPHSGGKHPEFSRRTG